MIALNVIRVFGKEFNWNVDPTLFWILAGLVALCLIAFIVFLIVLIVTGRR